MKLTCPECAAVFPIAAALTDEQARQAVAAALKLPAPLGDRILRYLGMFRPASRALSWDRATRLLTELLEPIQAAQVTREGITRPAPLDLWIAGLDQMLGARDRLRLPLKSHGYLFEIVAGLAEKAAGRHERKAEDVKRSSGLPTGKSKVVRNTGPKAFEAYAPEQLSAQMTEFRKALKGNEESTDAGE